MNRIKLSCKYSEKKPESQTEDLVYGLFSEIKEAGRTIADLFY